MWFSLNIDLFAPYSITQLNLLYMITLCILSAFTGTRKQLIKGVIICLCIDIAIVLSCTANAQDRKQCAATTKTGTQCSRKADSVYCSQHNPLTPKCSERAKSTSKQCSRPVKKEGDKCFQHNSTVGYLYNAYDKKADENFVLKAYTLLPKDTLVNYDNNAVVTTKKTPYTARIISLYTK